MPRLNHLEVLGPLQRGGIGSALLRAGEATARKLGHRRVALGVGVDNPGCHQEQQRQRSVTSPPPTHGQR